MTAVLSRTAELLDGMRVVVCGSASPLGGGHDLSLVDAPGDETFKLLFGARDALVVREPIRHRTVWRGPRARWGAATNGHISSTQEPATHHFEGRPTIGGR